MLLRIAGFIILSLTVVGQSVACDAARDLPIKLFNEVHVQPASLHGAEREAAWLLGLACVKVTWIHCPVPVGPPTVPCGAADMELHVLAHPLTEDFSGEALGFAMPSRGHAAVFVSRIQETAQSSGLIEVADLLGYAMAHEIGHVLLRSTAHSSEGLMRGHYQASDLKRAAAGLLKFTSRERDAIHASMIELAQR